MPQTPAPASTPRGKLIVLEGIDGAGTTTQLGALREHFRATGRRAVFTFEPSDGPVGSLIRLALQGRVVGGNFALHEHAGAEPRPAEPFDAAALALLFAADRADHAATTLEPNLRAGRHVVCDRYLLSTLAYQGQHAERGWLLEINRPALVPDLTLFLDVPPHEAEARMRGSRWKRDVFETSEQQRRIRERYLEVLDAGIARVGRVERIDSSRPAAEVTAQVLALVDGFLGAAEAA